LHAEVGPFCVPITNSLNAIVVGVVEACSIMRPDTKPPILTADEIGMAILNLQINYRPELARRDNAIDGLIRSIEVKQDIANLQIARGNPPLAGNMEGMFGRCSNLMPADSDIQHCRGPDELPLYLSKHKRRVRVQLVTRQNPMARLAEFLLAPEFDDRLAFGPREMNRRVRHEARLQELPDAITFVSPENQNVEAIAAKREFYFK
jgi:hypothetical protein